MRGVAGPLRVALAMITISAVVVACGDSSSTDEDTVGADTTVVDDTAAPHDTTVEDDTTVVEDTASSDDTATVDDTLDTSDGPDGLPDPDTGESDVTCSVDCPEDEVRCDTDGGGVETCVADDNGCTSWSAPVACEDAKVCQAGACVAACSSDDERCLGDAAVQRCVGGQLVEEGCPFGCDSVAVACRPCVPGAWRCGDGQLLEVCAQSGAWQSAGPCIDCACVAGPPVAMSCLGQDDTATSCAACGDDGQICVPQQ